MGCLKTWQLVLMSSSLAHFPVRMRCGRSLRLRKSGPPWRGKKNRLLDFCVIIPEPSIDQPCQNSVERRLKQSLLTASCLNEYYSLSVVDFKKERKNSEKCLEIPLFRPM